MPIIRLNPPEEEKRNLSASQELPPLELPSQGTSAKGAGGALELGFALKKGLLGSDASETEAEGQGEEFGGGGAGGGGGLGEQGAFMKNIKFKANELAVEFRVSFYEVSIKEGENLFENFKIPLLMTFQGAIEQVNDFIEDLHLNESQAPSFRRYVMLQFYSAKCASVVERWMKQIEDTKTEDVLMDFARQERLQPGAPVEPYLQQFEAFVRAKQADILDLFDRQLDFPAPAWERQQTQDMLDFVKTLFKDNLALCLKFWLKEGRGYILKYREKVRKFIDPARKDPQSLSTFKLETRNSSPRVFRKGKSSRKKPRRPS